MCEDSSFLEGSHHVQGIPSGVRRDVVAVARKRESTLTQIAKDFGISETCLHRWLKLADVEDGVVAGVTSAEAAEIRELRKRNRVLEQESEILRCAAAFFARGTPRMERPTRPSTWIEHDRAAWLRSTCLLRSRLRSEPGVRMPARTPLSKRNAQLGRVRV